MSPSGKPDPGPAEANPQIESSLGLDHDDEAYFRTHTWCNQYLDDPSYVRLRAVGKPDEGPTGHTLFSQTFNTPDTIAACMALYRTPAPGQPVTETVTFLALGSGLNGHVDTAHGGTTAAILDEIAGLMLRVGSTPGGDPHLPIFTAFLHVNYLRPVRTPQVVGAWARITGVQGRKKWVVVEIRDREGQALASGEALFVRVKGEGKL